LNNTLEIKKTVNIDLNGNNITAPEKAFLIQGGSLKLTGNGKIVESSPNYGAVMLIGSDNSTDENFSTVSVDSGIILEGWSGIFIDHHNKTGYGITVNMNGTINAVNDVNGGTGIGVYVNGNIKHQNNAPIINLGKTAKITSTGNGIYSAGYATYNINGAYIEGKESGLGIKSGVFNINDGTIIGSGEDKTPTNGNNNGINPSGVAIQIESNKGYSGNIKLNIKDGTINSKNSNVIYEYTAKNSETNVKAINLSGGTYISDVNKNVFLLSDSFKNSHSKFISGGKYSSNPSNYLKSGYSTSVNNDLYIVSKSTMSVFGNNNQNHTPVPFITITILFLLSIISYFNRNIILNLTNKLRKK